MLPTDGFSYVLLSPPSSLLPPWADMCMVTLLDKSATESPPSHDGGADVVTCVGVTCVGHTPLPQGKEQCKHDSICHIAVKTLLTGSSNGVIHLQVSQWVYLAPQHEALFKCSPVLTLHINKAPMIWNWLVLLLKLFCFIKILFHDLKLLVCQHHSSHQWRLCFLY